MEDGELAPKKWSTALEMSSKEERVRVVQVTAADKPPGIRMCSSPDGDKGESSVHHRADAQVRWEPGRHRQLEVAVHLRRHRIVEDRSEHNVAGD